MAAPLDFYFDYSSPYGYFAAMKIDDLAAKHGREVNWSPILLGAVFKISGGSAAADLAVERTVCAARHPALRALSWHRVPTAVEVSGRDPGAGARVLLGQRTRLRRSRSGSRKRCIARTLSPTATFRAPKSRPTWRQRWARKRDDVLAALNDPAVKDWLKNEVDAAIKLGVFGSPYIVVDGEPFWGIDRFDQLERWLARGPF